MTTYLDELLATARARVADDAAREPLAQLRGRAGACPVPPSFVDALTAPGVSVIAEIKRASPSRGAIAPGVVADHVAAEYLAGGAAAISVLTEPSRFNGSLADLSAVAALGAPTLRKDFIVDPYQVWQARAAGASAVLLIVAALDDAELATLQAAAHEAHLSALVEVHDRDECERALAAGAQVIGVNARDLRSFTIDPERFTELRSTLTEGVIAVAESGVSTPDDVRRLGAHGADAVLVGEAVVTAGDRRAAVAALVAAGTPVDHGVEG